MNSDTYVGVDENGRHVAIDYGKSDNVLLAFIDVEQNKDPNYVHGFKNGKYNLVVTIFSKNTFDEAVEYALKNGYESVEIEKDDIGSDSGGDNPPSYDDSSIDTVSQRNRSVNQYSERIIPQKPGG